MRTNVKYGFILPFMLVGCLSVNRVWGQSTDPIPTPTADPTTTPDLSPYMPIVEVPLIGKATVTFPGQAPIKVSKDDLGDVIGDYVEKLSNQLSPDNVLGSISDDLNTSFANIKDDLSDEVSGLIGEKEDEIMAGISDRIAQLAAKIADVGTTPAGEVERLKKMVAQGYTAQQKITYQTLKVDYAWKKSHTTLSPEFCSYYKELNIKGLFDAIKTHVQNLDNILASGVFTDQEREGYKTLIKSAGETKDLASAVNIVCNLGSNGRGVTVSWMAQGERMDVLDQSAESLKRRLENVGSLRDQLRRIYVYRIAKQQSDEFKQGSFQNKSGLNHVYKN